MNPMVESAWIAAGAAVVGVVGTATVGIVGFLVSRSTNQKTIAAAQATTAETLRAAHATNKATINAAHEDVRRTLDATRDGQVADRYSKAIDQLGSDHLDMRIGGIYALEGVARDSPRDHAAVMDVLSAFVRVRSRMRHQVRDAAKDTQGQQLNQPDVQAAVTVIARRDTARDGHCIDLSYANLDVADLKGAKLHGAKLTGASFWSADLRGADLSDAELYAYTNLSSAHLNGADLSGAKVWGSCFDDADLDGANLTGVVFDAASMLRVDLTHAILDKVKFRGGTNLVDARVPERIPIPPEWVRDPETGRVSLASKSDSEAENNT